MIKERSRGSRGESTENNYSEAVYRYLQVRDRPGRESKRLSLGKSVEQSSSSGGDRRLSKRPLGSPYLATGSERPRAVRGTQEAPKPRGTMTRSIPRRPPCAIVLCCGNDPSGISREERGKERRQTAIQAWQILPYTCWGPDYPAYAHQSITGPCYILIFAR